ncbi:MAG: hypothetical protein ABI369_08375 [Acetobacteraceae bacterium]
MMRRLILLAALATPALFAAGALQAQTATTGSVGCTAITQAAATGAANTVAADNQTIQQPQSVSNLTCLDNIFGAAGLNLVTNLLNPATLLSQVENQICSAIKSEWNSVTSGATCGISLTGFNLGIGGLGGGLSCPRLSFGGGGPPLASFGFGAGGSGLYINGSGQPPTGYSLPATPQGTF